MNDESDDDKCNCPECSTPPNRTFRLKESKKELLNNNVTKNELPGLRKGFLVAKKISEETVSNKEASETPFVASSSVPTASREPAASKQKCVPPWMPETIECERVAHPEIRHEEEKVDLKCTKCIETNDIIDIHNQGAFRVMCTDGCTVTLHRSCFEKALGSGKKKELKVCICPTDDCGCSVAEITHRIPGRCNDFIMWLRCDVKESERPKKEEKGKEVKKKEEKKDKDKDKYKKDRREEQEGRKVEETCTPSGQPNVPNCAIEETPLISLALPTKSKDDDAKKNLVKPLPADLEARPIERKEDALMSKYAVKDTIMKENRKKNKKEVRQVVLPGLTVKGQRGKKEEEDLWNVNEPPSPMEQMEGSSASGVGRMENNTEMRYDDGPYGFAMPVEVHNHGMQFGEGEWNGGGIGEMMVPIMDTNNRHNPFHHPLPLGNVFRPVPMNEAVVPLHSSQSLYEHNGHDSLSGFTESPAMDEPPLIENPFDYPTLERESVRERKELVNFFEIHTPVLEENAALFDSSQIDLDQLKDMLENFIEFQFFGNEEEKRNMTETLHSIFAGEVENDIIPFLIDLQCFKYGYVDGRLVVSVKTEGRKRRERDEQIRRQEEQRKEEVRQKVMELEEKRQREVREREELARIEKEEEERKAREKRRREEEELRQVEKRRREEAEERARMKEREREREREREKKEEEEKKIREKMMEEEERKKREEEREKEKRRLEEKRKEEEEEREKKMIELIEEQKRKMEEAMSSKKDSDKKAKQKDLERKTREAINALRNQNQTKGASSNESSPERKQLDKLTGSIGSSSSSLTSPPPPSSSSSTAFSTSAAPFIPRSSTNSRAELNPNAPVFIPTHPAVDVPILTDENGDEVNETWMETNKLKHEENVNTIEALNRRIAQLEADNREMADRNRAREMEMLKNDGTRMNENKINNEKIVQLESTVRDIHQQIVWKDQKISQVTVESEKKSDELNNIRMQFNSTMEDMKSKIREAKSIATNEKREKEGVMEMREREEYDKRRSRLERKTACAKDATLLCTHIINRLATDPEAQVMTSIFIDQRKKWMNHHSILDQSINALNSGEAIDWEMTLSLEEPSLPRETDELVKECYVWHYQTMHILSFRLAGIVKKCLNENKRFYPDAYIIGIIQKWMRTHKDPTKIDATVPQVANMVAQAMGDTPLMPPKYVYVTFPTPPAPPSAPPSSPHVHLDRVMPTNSRGQSTGKMEPKGWKKASDKVRQVDMHDHECSICLEDTEGGDISYCEQVSCNEPYHNYCLDQYWKTGGRNCPRCRTPMPPRDAFPALG